MNRFPDTLFHGDWRGADQIYINLARIGAYSELVGESFSPSTCPGLFTELQNGGAIVSFLYQGENFSCGQIQPPDSGHGIKYDLMECGRTIMQEIKGKFPISDIDFNKLEVTVIILSSFVAFEGFEKMSKNDAIFIEGDQREVIFPPFQDKDGFEKLSREKQLQSCGVMKYRGVRLGEKYFYKKLI